MQQLTNEEIARVFALYLGQKVFSNSLSNGVRTLTANDLTNILYSDEKGVLNLTPLPAITYEHALEVARLHTPFDAKDFNRYIENGTFKIKKTSISIKVVSLNGARSATLKEVVYFHELSFSEYQYLIQQGYAVPLFFGVGHWANNKTAIELEIAIDKTTLQATT